MSKSSSSRLTASRKRRRKTSLDVVWQVAVEIRCWRLDMMAALLTACGQPLEPAVLEGVGDWVRREVAAVRALLDEAGKAAR